MLTRILAFFRLAPLSSVNRLGNCVDDLVFRLGEEERENHEQCIAHREYVKDLIETLENVRHELDFHLMIRGICLTCKKRRISDCDSQTCVPCEKILSL